MPVRHLPFALFLLAFSAMAADVDGRYAVKGAGMSTCRDFIAARTDAGRYGIYQGWLDGYLSGFNRFGEQTYDLTPWAGNHLLLALIDQHCRAHPNERFHLAVQSMLAGFQGQRLQRMSRVVQLPTDGDALQWTYVEIIRRAQGRLKDLGLYQGAADGVFSEETRGAVRRFQEHNQLSGTGQLSQSTLYLLFKEALGSPAAK